MRYPTVANTVANWVLTPWLRARPAFVLASVLSTLGWVTPAWSVIEFDDVSDSALHGRTMSAESWGISVGDYDGDHWLDLIMGNHRNRASLYRNNGDGSLSDVILTAPTGNAVSLRNRYTDQHMLGFGDIDGDGDDDVGNHIGPNFYGTDGGFIGTSVRRISTLDMASRTVATGRRFAPYCIPMDYDRSQNFTLFRSCHYPARPVTVGSRTIAHVMDLKNADLDGDGDLDIITARGSYFVSDASLITPTRLEASFAQYDNRAKSFTFRASPPLTVRVWTGTDSAGRAQTINGSTNFNNVSFSMSGDRWTVSSNGAHVVVTSRSPMTSLTPMTNLRLSDGLLLPTLLKADGRGGWTDASVASGLYTGLRCNGVTAADFDNDMDLDLYFSCRGGGVNLPNRLYRNNGSGYFIEVDNAGGAAGRFGGAMSDLVGTTNIAVITDYDNDGFIDIFATNGHLDRPLRRGGPHQLFRNKGTTGNNWIQLKLRGSSPNFDAIGAKVTAVAGGKSQVRFLDGGSRRYSSDMQRVHFGLAQNAAVNLKVRWPNGTEQTFNNVQANRLYTLSQGANPVPVNLQPAREFATPTAGNDCGTPSIQPDLDYNLFLYKTSCQSNQWEVRVSPGSQRTRTFQGLMVPINGGTISNVIPRNLESTGGDRLSSSGNQVSFSFSGADNAGDGFSFTLNGDACLGVTSPDGVAILVGPNYRRIGKGGINPRTLQACALDTDGDGILDDVDPDDDNDGVLDGNDAFPKDASESVDTDRDGIGNNADTDDDGDGVNDADDWEPLNPREQYDTDNDGIGNNADNDDDGDGTIDANDAFPLNPNETADSDGDGVGDNADQFPNNPNEDTDSDGDGVGDNSDIDADNDGMSDDTEARSDKVITDWTNASRGVTATGNNIAFTGAAGFWNSQINSVPMSRYGFTDNYRVSWTVDNVSSSDVLMGLGISDSGPNYADVDRALYIASNNILYNYENGSGGTQLGSVASGDRLSIEVGGGQLRYRRNGTVLLTRSVSGTPDFYVDMSYYRGGIRLNNYRVEPLSGVVNPDADGDGVNNPTDLDSDNDTIADVIEVGLADANGDFMVDNISDQGSITTPRDRDGDGIPDYLDIESTNAANDGTAYDISGGRFAALDTNGDGMLSSLDTNGGSDANGNGVDDSIESVNPQPVEVAVADVTVNESAGTASVGISLSRATTRDVTATVFTRNGTAIGGQDYYGITQSITIAAGATSTSVSVTVLDDANTEGNESFSIRLINANGANIGDGTGVVTITDNDSGGGTPSLSINDATTTENVGSVTLNVSIDRSADAEVTVFTRAGTATAGSDFYGLTRTLNFRSGGPTVQNVVITIVNDTSAEATENLQLRLINASGASIADGVGSVTITDDD